MGQELTDVKTEKIQAGNPETEWKRSHPDVVVYLPKDGDRNDQDNEHFCVFHAPKSDELLAIWTQSSCESYGDNHIVFARSADGEQWSEPEVIAGPEKDSPKLQASWAFPILSKSGRIYCFYSQEVVLDDGHEENADGAFGAVVDEFVPHSPHWSKKRSGCVYGLMDYLFSDDNGKTWKPGSPIEVPKTPYDDPNPNNPAGWIVWQIPQRCPDGRYLAPASHGIHGKKVDYKMNGWWDGSSFAYFIRFDNIDDDPEGDNIKISWLPENGRGLTVPHKTKSYIYNGMEPSVVTLPDGRLFATLRTYSGRIWYTLSEDNGCSWQEPEVLRYFDQGPEVLQPAAPCPIYPMSDGRFLLVYHNNEGSLGQYDQFQDGSWELNLLNHIRRPGFIAVGHYKPDVHQPIWFSDPVELFDTDGIIVGPKQTAEIATYTSFTEYKGKRILWYPDRKYYLLGKYITDDILSSAKYSW